jgi:hypothetical protein
MAGKPRIGYIVFAVINVVVAFFPPCAGLFGAMYHLTQPTMVINNRDLGPQFKQHLDRELPSAKWEAFGAEACNGIVLVAVLAGAAGLFLAQDWGRWVSIGAGVLVILTLCIHDVYQLALFRPSVMEFLDVHLPPGPQREGFKVGFTSTFFIWSCINPLLMVYFIAASLYLGLGGPASRPADDDKPRKRRRRDDDHR